MPNFSSLKDLEKYLKEKIADSMEDVGKMAKAKAKRHVETDVYAVADPEEYIRTGELRDSIVYDTDNEGNRYQVEIYNDSELIGSYAPNQHYSVYHSDGSGDKPESSYPLDYSEYVAETVQLGRSGLIFGFGYWTKKRPYMRNAAKEIKAEKLHLKTLGQSLKKSGIETRWGNNVG